MNRFRTVIALRRATSVSVGLVTVLTVGISGSAPAYAAAPVGGNSVANANSTQGSVLVTPDGWVHYDSVLASVATTDVAQAATPTAPPAGCATRTTANIAEYDAYTNPLVVQGKITKTQQDHLRCHPDDLSTANGSITPVQDVTTTLGNPMQASSGVAVSDGAAVRVAVSCGSGFTYKSSLEHRQNDPGLIAPAFKAVYSLNWSYNKKTRKVRDWSGRCDGEVTTYGRIQGWSFEGCTSNDFIPYTLSKSYPGGVHHYMKMHFVNNFTVRTVAYDFVEQIWGHWDGSCDTKPHKGTVYNAC